jgi:hypothetical protein
MNVVKDTDLIKSFILVYLELDIKLWILNVNLKILWVKKIWEIVVLNFQLKF